MKLYVIRAQSGLFFRPAGMSGRSQWVEKLEQAKFYAKMGVAKSQVTTWYRTCPTKGAPDILEFTLDPAAAQVIPGQPLAEEGARRAKEKELRRKRAVLNREKEALEKRLKELYNPK